MQLSSTLKRPNIPRKATELQINKGKAILVQDCTDPEGSRRMRLSDFRTIDT